MEWKTLIILYGDTCCNSRSHPHKNQYNYTTDILHFYFWQNGTGSSLFLKPTTDAKVFGFWGASFSRFGCFVLRSSFSSASFSKLPQCLFCPIWLAIDWVFSLKFSLFLHLSQYTLQNWLSFHPDNNVGVCTMAVWKYQQLC